MPSKVWSGVTIALQSAIGADQAISGVTKANPGVATYAGTDPSNGDYLLIKNVAGMHQLNNRVVRAASVDTGANTLALESIDTTLYSTWGTGDLAPLTFGTTLGGVFDVQMSGGEPAFIDDTTIHDLIQSEILTVFSPIQAVFEHRWDPSDAGLIALENATIAKAARAVLFTFADGAKFALYASVACFRLPTGGAQQRVGTRTTFRGLGFPTSWAS
jgi:hypothetical protein